MGRLSAPVADRSRGPDQLQHHGLTLEQDPISGLAVPFTQTDRSDSSHEVRNPIKHLTATAPDVRVRGTAQQIFERYVALAREAATSGDRIAAENYYQHAGHYFRISNNSLSRPATPADAAPQTREAGSSGDEINREEPGIDDDADS